MTACGPRAKLLSLILIILSLLSQVDAQRRNRKAGFDIHARATWKVSDECEFGCIGGEDKENKQCGTQEECSVFLAKVANADYLMYGVLSVFAILMLFVCCVWSDQQ